MDTEIDIKKPESLNEFLTQLPQLCHNKYSEAIGYYLWKTLNECLSTENDKLNWRRIVNSFEEISKSEEYVHVLQDDKWKRTFITSNMENNHQYSMCRRQCYPIESVYVCLTCSTNPLYEICDFCFDKDQHKNHNYTTKIVNRDDGRICNCGNPSVFKDPRTAFLCKNKINNKPRETYSVNKIDTTALQTISTILDYIINVLLQFHDYRKADSDFLNGHQPDNEGNELHPADSNNSLTPTSSRSTPPPLDNSTDNLQLLIYMQYAQNKNLDEKWVLQIHEEKCNMHPRDLASKLIRILNKPSEYALSIVERFEENRSPVTILESDDYTKLSRIHDEFTKNNIKTCIVRMCDYFKQQLIENLIDWVSMIAEDIEQHKNLLALRIALLKSWRPKLEEVSQFEKHLPKAIKNKINLFGQCVIGSTHDNNKKDNVWFRPWDISFMENDSEVFDVMKEYNIELLQCCKNFSSAYLYEIHGSRFQYLLTECIDNLSKNSFQKIMSILSCLFSITDNTRKCLAIQYFDVYLNILSKAVTSEVGRQISLLSLLCQYTFQDPEFANLAIRNKMVERSLRYAITLINLSSKNLKFPYKISLNSNFKLPMTTIQNRRSIICLKDMSILLSTNTLSTELLADESLLDCIITSFSQFNNILPLKRETAEHVEFENFEFAPFFFLFSSILIMTDSYVRNITLVTDKAFRTKIINKILDIAIEKEFTSLTVSNHVTIAKLDENNTSSILNATLVKFPETISNHLSNIIEFQVGVNTQSLLNPMVYLFKYIIQWSQCGRYEPLKDDLKGCLDITKIFENSNKALQISESSLCTLVLLGQVNVGFWVRNGAPISQQTKMYTSYSMREYTFVSDIFNVQFSMCMADPDDFLVTYFSRWGLKNWSNGIPVGDYPDKETTIAIVGEALLLLTQLLTEVKSLDLYSSVDSFEKTLKVEIIHAICFDSCSYSEIMESIPEHITKHSAFDCYLKRYTNFCTSTDPKKSGLFTLKEEYKEEIDPYYYGLSSNKRYQVEKAIRTNMMEKKNLKYDQTFIKVKNVNKNIERTQYANLFAITSRDTFGIFLKHTLDYIKKYKNDYLLPKVVHLIHTAMVNNLNAFGEIFWREYTIMDIEFYHYYSIGSILYSCLLIDEFSNMHGEIREIFNILKTNAPHIDIESYLSEQVSYFNPDIIWNGEETETIRSVELEKKKKRARARKEKIMKKLLKQQQEFLENNKEATSDEDISMESSISISSLPKSCSTTSMYWKLPEDYCIFCKMSRENDTFVYFSYQELNVCEHSSNLDLADGKHKATKNLNHLNSGILKERPVLRVCGHVSHITCLGKHMRSVRVVQSQTTKNIPTAFGYGLIYCPVCNSLSNSFIPEVEQYTPKYLDDFFNKNIKISSPTPGTKLSSPSNIKKESIFIFKDLFSKTTNEKLNSYGVINNLLVNTVCNVELSIRPLMTQFNVKIFKEQISSQYSLTLGLLTELKYQIFDSDPSELLPLENCIYLENIDWYRSFLENINENLLIYVSTLFERTKSTSIDGSECFLKVIMMKLLQDFLAICGNFSRIPNNYKNVEFPSNEEHDDKLEMLNELTNIYLKSLSLETSKITENTTRYIYSYLLKSLTIFLRRSYIIFFSRYPEEMDNVVNTENKEFKSISEFEFYLQRFKLNGIDKFSEIIKIFLNEVKHKDLNDFLERQYSRERVIASLTNLSFISPEPLTLVELPHNLSDICLQLERNHNIAMLKSEPAICLFCGKVLNFQRQVAIHKFSLGECANHYRNQCPFVSTVGLFLIVKSNAIFLAYGDRGTFINTPYRNAYGEKDMEFKYDSPVYLDQQKYQALIDKVFLGNMIPHIVYRKSDGNADLGGWETL